MARLTDDAGEMFGNVPRPRSYSGNDHAHNGLRVSLILTAYFLLTSIHLYCNWRCVTCLQFRTFNRARFHLVFGRFLLERYCLKYYSESKNFAPRLANVSWANRMEPIFSWLPQLDAWSHGLESGSIVYKLTASGAQRSIAFGCGLRALPLCGSVFL
ncbi:unnamed protein product [Protopolystoma xenopodis]|uniref:Protein root UVB sensitive/RUS domain-containing protein n=1 Tax=Protopolystoma xenopodis TaxID=117903 RepID=A0A3S5AMF7_9PLAT|nr:unnamed protein product [Protopolystoma xenopodis]